MVGNPPSLLTVLLATCLILPRVRLTFPSAIHAAPLPPLLSRIGPFSRLAASAILRTLLRTRNVTLTPFVIPRTSPILLPDVFVRTVLTTTVDLTSVFAPSSKTKLRILLLTRRLDLPILIIRLLTTLQTLVPSVRISTVRLTSRSLLGNRLNVPYVALNVQPKSVLFVRTFTLLLQMTRAAPSFSWHLLPLTVGRLLRISEQARTTLTVVTNGQTILALLLNRWHALTTSTG